MELYACGDRSGNTWAYIRQYATDPLAAIMRAMKTIEQILTFIGELQAV